MEGTYKNTADIQISIITIVFTPALTSAPDSWSYLALNLRSLPGSEFEVPEVGVQVTARLGAGVQFSLVFFFA